jgi:hypothetical protein
MFTGTQMRIRLIGLTAGLLLAAGNFDGRLAPLQIVALAGLAVFASGGRTTKSMLLTGFYMGLGYTLPQMAMLRLPAPITAILMADLVFVMIGHRVCRRRDDHRLGQLHPFADVGNRPVAWPLLEPMAPLYRIRFIYRYRRYRLCPGRRVRMDRACHRPSADSMASPLCDNRRAIPRHNRISLWTLSINRYPARCGRRIR